MPEEPTNQAPQTTPEPGAAAPETFTVKVDGQERQVSREEAIKAYEKAQGADERFREASDLRKQASLGLEIQQLYQKLSDDTASEAEQSRWAELFGMDVNDLQNQQPPAAAQAPPSGDNKLPDRVEKTIKTVDRMEAQRAADEANRNFTDWAESALDKNETLGTLTKELEPGQKNQIREEVMRQVRNEVIVSMNQGEKLRPELVNRVMASAVTQLEKFGNLFRKVNAPIPGFGPTPDGLEVTSLSDTPPKRVAGTDPNYGSNFATRVLHKLAKGIR